MSDENEKITSNEEKDEELQKSINKENLNNSKIYSFSLQTNFSIISNIKNFKIPFSIQKSSLNYISIKSDENKEKNKKSFVQINNTSIFIGGRQNLKGMRIHLSNNCKYNNTVHKEITNFKNKSVDKTNVRLTENKNKPIEKVNIDLLEKEEKKNDIDFLKFMNLRWKNHQQVFKNRISFISNTNLESININKKNYIQGLLNKFKINTTKNSNNNNNNNNNQEKIILIKQDKYNINNNYIYEIISPSTKEELELSINTFINKSNDNKENQDNNNSETLSYKENNINNNGKKKSKFINQQEIQIKKTKEKDNNNKKLQKDDFVPIFILNNKDIIELYEIIEKNSNKNKQNKNNYSVDNKISLNFINKNEKLRGKNAKKTLDDINFDIFPVKVDKFEFINIVPNEIRTNYNIDVSNIALNQSDYMKQVKGGENDFDYILNKNKEMEDFSQNTPISLLQEKYFIYAVSKWIKYSIPNPQSQLYVKYSYKTGHPLFDPIHLIMTNFTLWIERIETKRNDNKKGIISISSSVNYNNNSLKNNKNFKGKSLTNKKKGYVNIYSNQNNNENNQINKKRNNSKSKVYK